MELGWLWKYEEKSLKKICKTKIAKKNYAKKKLQEKIVNFVKKGQNGWYLQTTYAKLANLIQKNRTDGTVLGKCFWIFLPIHNLPTHF